MLSHRPRRTLWLYSLSDDVSLTSNMSISGYAKLIVHLSFRVKQSECCDEPHLCGECFAVARNDTINFAQVLSG